MPDDEDDATDPTGLPAPAAPDDHPADVESALTHLVKSARDAVREGRPDEAVAAVDTARTVARNKLPDGAWAERIVHGCDRVADLAADDPPVAIEYLDAMRRRLP
ncbi:hypothetical protein [Halobaculum gomorrense]|uniref:DUF8101 domain-containing protein n=1 Tax=Halobaculum gomorrense TaxID=43928 RepID=A0A1M5S5L7_9EURY|nr:hypothetical protein [Halobaculum gomorrense]SHH33720.1 hypothetical protein SAMN05443636_2344 [Halobaculum gomorrense]